MNKQMRHQQTDGELLIGQRFGELWSRYEDKIRAYLLSRFDRLTNVDDVLQDTYMRLHNKHHSIKQPKRVGLWLRNTARNIARNQCRQKSLHKSRSIHAFPKQSFIDPKQDDPAGAAMMEEVKRQIFQEIDNLPEEQRETFQMVLDGGKIEDVASKLGVHEGTVDYRLKCCRRKILRHVAA